MMSRRASTVTWPLSIASKTSEMSFQSIDADGMQTVQLQVADCQLSIWLVDSKLAAQ